MTTVLINLSDDRAATLAARAEAQGMTLEDWIAQKLADEAPRRRPHYLLSELMEECDTEAATSDEDREWLDEPATGREAL